MSRTVARGTTSLILRVYVASTASAGTALTGMTTTTGGLNISVIREMSASPTVYTGANIVAISPLGTYAAPGSGKIGFGEVDPVNMPGTYELQLDNAVLATSDGSRSLAGCISGPTNCAVTPFEVELTANDPQAPTMLAGPFTLGLQAQTGLTNTQFLGSSLDDSSDAQIYYGAQLLVGTSVPQVRNVVQVSPGGAGPLFQVDSPWVILPTATTPYWVLTGNATVALSPSALYSTLMRTQMTETALPAIVPGSGSASLTLEQAACAMAAWLMNRTVTGSTFTITKQDQATTYFSTAVDNPTSPTKWNRTT